MKHEFNLENKEIKEVLTVNYGDRKFNIPLAKSLSVKEVSTMTTYEGVKEFLLKYIPEDIQETMTIESLTKVMEEWKKISEETGVSLGELSASRSS